MISAEELNNHIANYDRCLQRSNKFLQYLEDNMKCEICYERYQAEAYQCKRHRVCKVCHNMVHICPFCRSPKIGVYPDLWYFTCQGMDWFPLTEQIVMNGFRADFNYLHYVEGFASACNAAIIQVDSFAHHPPSIRMALRVVVDCVNRRANFPIFAWHKQQHFQYDANRWKSIVQSAIQKTNTPPERSSALVKAMRKHISKLLRKIKEVAPLAGLNYRNYQDE